jgi:hypothetical protein
MDESSEQVTGIESGRVQPWNDLPKQPWPENIEPPIADLVDWLLSMDREQLAWFLDRRRQDWRRDSECLIRDHDGRLMRAHDEQEAVHRDLVAILHALGISDHARPYSSHEVVQREVIPAIERLTDV